QNSKAFSGFSVNNLSEALNFYRDKLGLNVTEEGEMGLSLNFSNGSNAFIYPKENHQPATFTILNFPVNNIDEAISFLEAKGISLEIYSHMPVDEKGVLRGQKHNLGPDIAWFKDPAGNILSVIS